MKSLLPFALDYASRYGWAVHPVNVKKKPTTEHGRNDATTDADTIREYFKNGAQLSVATGTESNVFVLDGDLDPEKGYDGPARIAELEAKHGPLPRTPRQRTGRGGEHYFFRHFEGAKNSTSSIAPGVDTRGAGGYVVVAPSRNTSGAYEWIVAPDEAPVADAPQWLIDLVRKAPAAPAKAAAKTASAKAKKPQRGTIEASIALARLNKSRCDNYAEWVDVGMSLAELGDAGRDMWIEWSRQSDKFDETVCREKWSTFRADGRLTLASLSYWANEDDPSGVPSARVLRSLHKLGYTFRLNLCDNAIEVNGKPLDDIIDAEITTRAWDSNIQPRELIRPAYVTEAAQQSYHPVKDYLTTLEWDGKDHIGQLATHLHSDDAPIVYENGKRARLVAVYLKRWMVGAVAKALDRKQNVMLVLAGPQNIGKSALAKWLCSGIPDRFIEGPIRVDDKDSSVRLMSRFIWEVSELDATTRRSDVSALKDFITRDEVTVRKAYGRHDTIKPALASMIGTVNECAGFLSDESGNRRFMVTSITSIDWKYTSLDVNQLWAQAVALYRAGEPWRLTAQESKVQAERNQSYDVETALDGWMQKWFFLDVSADYVMTSADIVDHLRRQDIHLNGNERAQAMEISRILARHHVQKVRTSSWRGYRGIAPRDNPMTTYPMEVVTINTAPQSQNDNVTTYDNLNPIEVEEETEASATLGGSTAYAREEKSCAGDSIEKAVTGCHVVISASGSGKTSDNHSHGVVTGVVTTDRDIGRLNMRKPNVNDRLRDEVFLGDDDAND